MKQVCRNCRFFEELQIDDGPITQGFCRRFPPLFVGKPTNYTKATIDDFTHPITAQGNWCGEWEIEKGQKETTIIFDQNKWEEFTQSLPVRVDNELRQKGFDSPEKLYSVSFDEFLETVRGIGPNYQKLISLKFLEAYGVALMWR